MTLYARKYSFNILTRPPKTHKCYRCADTYSVCRLLLKTYPKKRTLSLPSLPNRVCFLADGTPRSVVKLLDIPTTKHLNKLPNTQVRLIIIQPIIELATIRFEQLQQHPHQTDNNNNNGKTRIHGNKRIHNYRQQCMS